MITVELKQLRFFAYHGLYPEERKTGNEFIIDLAVSYEPDPKAEMNITSVINYADLYQLIKDQFNTPVDLLEILVINIAGEIKSAYPQTKKIQLTVSKLHPPIPGFSGHVSVSYQKSY